MCDIAIHIHCLTPPLSKVPQKNWFCDNCIKCLGCQTQLNSIKDYNEGFWNLIDEKDGHKQRLCEECFECYNLGNYCAVCMLAYHENTSDNFVGCDECDRWIHADCDGISGKDFQKYENSDVKYICPYCRKTK